MAFAFLWALASNAGAEEGRQPGAPPFWDRYVAYNRLLATRPDSAAGHAAARIWADPHDFFGRWLRGAYRSGKDSVAADSSVREALAVDGEPGILVESGVILFARARVAEGRTAFERARRAYVSRSRVADASRANLWMALNSWQRGDRAAYAQDIAAAESLARVCRDTLALCDVLVQKGGILTRTDYALARRVLEEPRTLLEALPPGYQLVACYRILGGANRTLGDQETASQLYGRAVELARAMHDTTQTLLALSGLAGVRRHQGRYQDGADIVEQALALAKAGGDRSMQGRLHHDLGAIRDDAGSHLEARDHFEEALRLYRASGSSYETEIFTIDGLGGVETVLGNYERARERLDEALAIARKRKIRTALTFVLFHLAGLERELGNLEEARALADEGLAAAREAGQKALEGVLQSEKARILLDLGRPSEALDAVRAAHAIGLKDEPRVAWRLCQAEAAALHALGRTPDGMAVLDSAIAAFAADADSNQLARTLGLQGALMLAGGDRERAGLALARSLAIAFALGSPGRIADARLTLGAARLEAGRPDLAIQDLEQGLAWFERVQSAVKAGEERSAYQTRWNDAYVSLAQAYARTGRPESAFATLERSRSRELRRLFARKPAALRSRLPAPLAREMGRAESELTQVQSNLMSQYELPRGRRPASLAPLERRVDSLQSVWSALNRRAQREAADYSREIGLVPAIRVAEVKRALRPGERLVAFMVGERGSLAFDFWNGRFEVRDLPWGEDALAARVDRMAGGLRDPGSRNSVTDAAGLADTLLGLGSPGERPARVLFIVPDAALHRLPFEALRARAESNVARRYLTEGSEIVYAPSATLLFRTPPARGNSGTRPVLVAFGDPAVSPATATAEGSQSGGELPVVGPLPFARREVSSIQAAFPGSRVFVGDQATEGRFFTETGAARILHVAAHAFVDDVRPEFSGIVLAPTPGGAGQKRVDDGLVQAFEVAQHRYDVELATLSACETGRGRLLRGEGLIGLARAFRLAGVKNLVVSLWKVDDAATAEFMAEFYRRLGAGATPAAALRGTKVAFLSATPGPAPSNARSLASLDGALPDSLASDEAPAADSAGTSSSRGVGRHRRSELMREPPVWAAFVLHGSR